MTDMQSHDTLQHECIDAEMTTNMTPDTMLESQTEASHVFHYDFSGPCPAQLIGSYSLSDLSPSKSDNLLFKRIKWSPDGTFILSSNEDKTLRLFYTTTENDNENENENESDNENENENEQTSPLRVHIKSAFKEAESILDFVWYPVMSSIGKARATRHHQI